MTTPALDTLSAARSRVPMASEDSRPSSPSPWVAPALAMGAVCSALLLHVAVPAHQRSLGESSLYPRLLLLLGGGVIAGFGLQSISEPFRRWLGELWPRLALVLVLLGLWELLTTKLAWLPLPHFPGPEMVLAAVAEDWRLLLDCAWHSLLLLLSGYLAGTIAGLAIGIPIGWSAPARYWGMPVLKLLGPLPATAWIPLAIVLSPGSSLAATAIIALGVWFPVAMLTIAGVGGVRVAYLDVARTLGASRTFLIFRIALPAALPTIFVGLFMGLSAAFLTLVVAEGIGVSAGLGWYADTARSGMEYSRIYAALLITAVFFSILMTLLFKLRDRVLIWQKGTIRW